MIATAHQHEFPTEPPRGSLTAPGSCECGRAWDPATAPVIPPADDRSGSAPVFALGPEVQRHGNTLRLTLAHPDDTSLIPAALAVLRLDARAIKDLLDSLRTWGQPIVDAYGTALLTNPALAYSDRELAWYAENYGSDEWMVHVSGPDDCHTHANPDLDDDDPNNPPFDQESALKFAKGIGELNTWYAAKFPAEGNPELKATIFRFGVPWTVATPAATDEGA